MPSPRPERIQTQELARITGLKPRCLQNMAGRRPCGAVAAFAVGTTCRAISPECLLLCNRQLMEDTHENHITHDTGCW